MAVRLVLFAVFAMTMANATVYATLGLFGRSVGVSEFQVGTIFASSGLLFALTSSRWGAVADRRGRRPVIVIGLGGTAASVLLFAGLFALRAGDLGPAVLFVVLLAVRILYGLLAGGTQPAATAYMADITTAKTRSIGAAWVGAAVGLGSIVGPTSAALLVGLGLATPLMVGGVLALLAAALTSIGVPQTRSAPKAKRNPTGSSLKGLSGHAALAFLMYFGLAALQPTTAFFVQDLFEIEITLAVQRAAVISATFAGCSFVVQAWGVSRLGLAPSRLLSIGVTVGLMGIVCCLMASDFYWLLVAFGVAGIGYGLAQPGLTAAAMLAADSHRQGEVAGHIHAASSAAWVVGPLVGTAVYALDIKGPLILAAVTGAMMLFWTAGRFGEGRGLRSSNPPPAPGRCSSSCRRSAR